MVSLAWGRRARFEETCCLRLCVFLDFFDFFDFVSFFVTSFFPFKMSDSGLVDDVECGREDGAITGPWERCV